MHRLMPKRLWSRRGSRRRPASARRTSRTRSQSTARTPECASGRRAAAARPVRLAVDSSAPATTRDGELRETGDGGLAMAEAVDGRDAEAEDDRGQPRALPVEGRLAGLVCGRLRRPSASVASPSGTLIANSQGQVPTARMPAATVGPIAAEKATTSALMPDAAAELAARVDEAHQRRVDAHDAGGAEALDDARDRQQRQRMRQRAEERRRA